MSTDKGRQAAFRQGGTPGPASSRHYPHRALYLAAAVAALGGSPIASAENKAEALETETIEVIGTAPLSSVGVPLNQVPANVQAATGKTIAEQKPTNLSEFLDRNLGSVSVNDTVGNPFQPDVTFRGFAASPLLGTPQGLSVFIDGVRVNEAFGDVVNWDLIPQNAIANINLVPGSNPLFGLNTLGGALSVHTKSGDENPGISASFSGGSWGRTDFEFEAGGKLENFDYFAAGNVFHEDGWRTTSDSDIKQFFTKGGWQDEKNNLDLAVSFADNEMHGIQGLPREMLDRPDKAYSIPDSITNKMVMVTLNGSRFFTDTKLLAANFYYRHNRARGFNSNVNNDYPGDGVVSASTSAACTGLLSPSLCDPLASNVVTTTDTDGFGGAVQFSFFDDVLGHKNQATIGASADIGRTSFDSDTELANVVGIETVSFVPLRIAQTVRLQADNDYYGIYATDTFSLTDELHLTVSGRFNIALVKLNGSSLDITDDTMLPGDLNGNHRYSRFNPAVGLNYNPVKWLNVYGGYNEGMRAPSPIELACADPNHPCALPNAFGGDPDLKEVISRTWEGGFRGTVNEWLGWNVGIYRTENSDDILFIASSASGAGYFQNVGTTLRQGVEVGLNGKAGRFRFFANYGYVDATFESPFVSSSNSNSTADANGNIQVNEGDSIPGIPNHTLKLRVDFDATTAWRVSSNVVVAASQYARGDENNRDANGKIPGYAVVNLDSSYSITKNWKVFAKISNLLDKDYATFGQLGVNEFTGPGRSFTSDPAAWNGTDQFRTPGGPRAGWVGVSYEFGKP